MTSGSFTSYDLDSIFVNRDGRQRRELRHIEELALSIKGRGLINPPVITREGELIAGERRLEACRALGWTSIPVQFTDELDRVELHLLELEENVKRLDLTWQEHNDAVAMYHKLMKERDPEWNQTATSQALGITPANVSQHLSVAAARESAPEELAGAEKFSTAIGIANRKQERVRDSVLREIKEPTAEDEPQRHLAIQHESFLNWCQEDQPTKFNLIHCDFPYGVNTGDKKGQSAAKSFGSYDDGEDVYWKLIENLLDNADNFIQPSAHMIFWFSMKHYIQTKQYLTEGGWKVDPFPLIWHKSDNAGIIPDSNRGPRRTYETALFCTRGDRKTVRPVANSFSGPTTKEFHSAEKSAAMLEHFFRMVLDDTTLLLDPTCGSGMAVKVAEKMGASYALGLEKEERFYQGALKNCGL